MIGTGPDPGMPDVRPDVVPTSPTPSLDTSVNGSDVTMPGDTAKVWPGPMTRSGPSSIDQCASAPEIVGNVRDSGLSPSRDRPSRCHGDVTTTLTRLSWGRAERR